MALKMPDITAKPDPYALWKNPNYRNYAGSWFLITFSRRIEFVADQLLSGEDCTTISEAVAGAGDSGPGAGAAGDVAGHSGRVNLPIGSTATG